VVSCVYLELLMAANNRRGRRKGEDRLKQLWNVMTLMRKKGGAS
jgi:hypothetical protein